MKVVDIADEIFRELSSPTDLSIPAIAYWVRSNIGALNNYINTDYTINVTTLEVEQVDTDGATVEIGEEEKSIIKMMYMGHFLDRKIRTSLVSMETNTVIAVTDQGSSVRKLNKNEITRTLASARNAEYENLQKSISSYKIRKSTPLQVAGDDTVEGSFGSNVEVDRTSAS